MKNNQVMNEQKKEKIKRISKQQWDKIRSAFIMCLICVLMLSGATYAWFTISNSAKVNQLALSIASEGHLYIGLDANNVRESEVSFQNMQGKVLYPATTNDGITIVKPIYTADNVVSGTAALTDAERTNNLYYYEQTVYLLIEETLPAGASANEYYITLDNNAGGDGTFVKSADANTNTHPERCVRMSFQVNGGNTAAIYEPNADVHNNGTAGTDYASCNFTSTLVTHKQSGEGNLNFTELDNNTRFYEGDSSSLFTITGGVVTPVTIRIWFEGTDTDCVNSIESQNIIGQIKFISHKKVV